MTIAQHECGLVMLLSRMDHTTLTTIIVVIYRLSLQEKTPRATTARHQGRQKKIVAHTTIKGYKYISSPKTALGATIIFFVALGVIMGDVLLVVAPSSNFGLRKNYRRPNL